MAFRRTREIADEQRRFTAFARDNTALFERIRLPGFLAENHREFIYFMMHGATSPDAPIEFSVDDFNAHQRAAYAALLASYLAAGLENPGW